MEISNFVTDPKKETEGVEVPVGDGFYITVARQGNERAAKLYEELTKDPQTKLGMRTGMIDPKHAEEVVVEVLAQTILLGWRGLTDKAIPVPYSTAKAKELLRLKDFRRLVQNASDTQEIFRANIVEDAVKN